MTGKFGYPVGRASTSHPPFGTAVPTVKVKVTDDVAPAALLPRLAVALNPADLTPAAAVNQAKTMTTPVVHAPHTATGCRDVAREGSADAGTDQG